jgi:LacI family transcriptional regulator
MKEITIQDIADAANVSKSTVSRVLNNTVAVNKEKREAVLEAAERLGFEPNVFARSLASGKSMTIGVLTQLMGSPFYDTISQGVISGLSSTDYSAIFVDGQWEHDEEYNAIRALVGRRVDGLVLIGGDVTSEEIAKVSSNLPTVIVARQLPQEQHDCIFVDNVEGGEAATRHLIECGHKRIAIIRGLKHHQDSIDRYLGYQRALNQAGIDLDEDLVVDGDFSAESGLRAIQTLETRGTPYTAVFVSNDQMAFGARLALNRAGKEVPADVSIVGFDDQLESSYMVPPLTTIRQPAREMGEQAAKAVLAIIRGEAFKAKGLNGELQLRESVANLNKAS